MKANIDTSLLTGYYCYVRVCKGVVRWPIFHIYWLSPNRCEVYRTCIGGHVICGHPTFTPHAQSDKGPNKAGFLLYEGSERERAKCETTPRLDTIMNGDNCYL
jgi:hypothetical protein